MKKLHHYENITVHCNLLTYFPLSAVYVGVETIEEEMGESSSYLYHSRKQNIPIEVRTNIYVTFSKKLPGNNQVQYQNIKQPELINNVMQLIRSNLRKELAPRKGGLEEVHFEDIRTPKHVALLENLYNLFHAYYKNDASLEIKASHYTHDQDMSQAAQVIFFFKPYQQASQNIIDKLLSLENKFNFFREELQQEAFLRIKHNQPLMRKASFSSNDEDYWGNIIEHSYSSNNDEDSDFECDSDKEDERRLYNNMNSLRF